jgi:Anti-sigma-28 factor, FlgM
LGSGPDAERPGGGRSLGYSDHMDPAVLKQQIDKGEYQIDPSAVADAMLRRLRAFAQSACSYPASGSSASTNATPGGPSTTDPTQVAFVNLFALRNGTQTQSS